MTRTRVNARTIVAWQDGEHRILDDGCLVLEDDRIIHVGPDYDGGVDQTIEAPNRLITPGSWFAAVLDDWSRRDAATPLRRDR
jgi:cytosine/adenosine deaminase-related metal-dependent hydrolase